jgi:hypothetical protein
MNFSKIVNLVSVITVGAAAGATFADAIHPKAGIALAGVAAVGAAVTEAAVKIKAPSRKKK